jgi:hypothetical protein
MNADEEVITYFEGLIDHYHDCSVQNCARCAVIRAACEFVRNRIFDSGVAPAAGPKPVTGHSTLFAQKTQ